MVVPLWLITNKNDILITRGRGVTNITADHTIPLFHTLQMTVPLNNHIGLSLVYLIKYTLVALVISTHDAGIKWLVGRLQWDYSIFQLCVILFWYIFVIYCGKPMQPHRKHHKRHQSKLKGQVGNRYENAVTKLLWQYTLYKASHRLK